MTTEFDIPFYNNIASTVILSVLIYIEV